MDTTSNTQKSKRPKALRKVELIPVSVTQETCEPVLGIPPRRFREWVRSRQIPHARLGKLVIVELSVALAALRAEAGDAETPAPATEVQRIRQAAGIRVGAR
jgi:hypothetical protein